MPWQFLYIAVPFAEMGWDHLEAFVGLFHMPFLAIAIEQADRNKQADCQKSTKTSATKAGHTEYTRRYL